MCTDEYQKNMLVASQIQLAIMQRLLEQFENANDAPRNDVLQSYAATIGALASNWNQLPPFPRGVVLRALDVSVATTMATPGTIGLVILTSDHFGSNPDVPTNLGPGGTAIPKSSKVIWAFNVAIGVGNKSTPPNWRVRAPANSYLQWCAAVTGVTANGLLVATFDTMLEDNTENFMGLR